MEENLYFSAYDDGEVVLMLKNWLDGTDCSRLVASIRTIATDAVPDGAVIHHAFDGIRWGKGAYSVDGYFVKASYVCRHADRIAPFAGLDEVEAAYITASAHGVPVPGFLGYFARRIGDEWVWAGVVTAFLDGWRVLDERNPDDVAMAKEAIRFLAANGVVDNDLHFRNLMTDGESWMLVDLDQFRETDETPKAALAVMANRCAALAATPALRDEMNRFVAEAG